ncbi:MAG TPA: o-succinylbenzoate synthase [Acidimicrobiales bacterium]|nr:o-succinylbenzoate synthase [Acidimicrobiales bacterium]
MRLVGVELVRVSLPLLAPWVTEAGEFSQRDSMLVRVIAHALNPQGEHVEVEGWGECGALPGPTYTSEYTAGAVEVTARHLLPALFAGHVCRATEVKPALAGARGHNMAKAALETAVLDAELRALGQPMAEYLASLCQGGQPPRAAVIAGVAVPSAPSPAELVDQVNVFVEAGYRRVKLKVGPGRDLSAVSAVRERWPQLILLADANGSYQHLPLSETADRLNALATFDLACIEQPLAEDDLVGHAELARCSQLPICLDESLSSYNTVVLALSLGACSVVATKAPRLGGYLEAVRVHDLCAQHGVPAWVGGLVETGIARAANIALASLPHFSLPGDLSATGRFFGADLTAPLPLARDGTISVPTGPGLGVAVQTEVVDRVATWRKWFPAERQGWDALVRTPAR